MIGNPGPSTGLLPGSPVQEPPAPVAPQASEPGRWSGSRLPLLVVAGAAALVLAAAGGFVLLNGPGGDEVTSGTVAKHVARTSPGASGTAGPSTTPAAPVPTGRNPFLGPVATATGAGSDPMDTSAPASASVPAPAGTVTQTVTATATYVGLYGFSGSKAVFWVNDTKYQVATGGAFAGFTYSGKTGAGCAQVKHGTTTTTLCPGTVKQLG